MSIKIKILLALVLTSTLGLGISFYFLYKDQVHKNEIEIVSSTSATGEARSLKVESSLSSVAGKIRNAVKQVETATEAEALARTTIDLSSTILSAWVYKENGQETEKIAEASKNQKYLDVVTPVLEENLVKGGLDRASASPVDILLVDGQPYGVHISRLRGKTNYYLLNLLNLDDILYSLTSEGLFRNYLVRPNGAIIYNSGKIGGEESIKFLNENVLKQLEKNPRASYGKKVSFNGSEQIYSVTRIASPLMYLVTVADTEKYSQPLALFLIKSGLVLLATICLAIIIAILFSKKISGPISQLTEATKVIATGEFQFDLDIHSRDEVGVLADNFKIMSDKIAQLLADLREYNDHLEDMVKQRTAELREALDLNKTMMNSVSQGFLMFDRELNVLPTYSKAAESILERNLENTTMLKLLEKEDKDGNLKDFLDLVFDEAFPFEDMIQEVPKNLSYENDKHVELEYFPVRDEEEKLNYVVSIATDKTLELKYRKELEDSSAFVNMVLKAVKDRKRFVGFITNTKEKLEHARTNPGIFNNDELFRFVHTLKGNSGIYHMKGVHEICSEFEEHIKKLEGDWKEDMPCADYVKGLLSELRQTIEATSDILGVSPETLEADLVISPDRLRTRLAFLKDSGKLNELKELELLLSYALMGEEVPKIESMVSEVAQKVGKPAPQLRFDGPDVYMRENQWLIISEQLVHLIRNSLDHGIESPSARVEKGKPEAGRIGISWGSQDNTFFLSVKDDGAGINVEGLKKKLLELGALTEEEFDTDKAGEYLFFDRVTTKQEVSDISGQGVGLASVRSEIVKMGGDIHVDFKVGAGTAFTITLPVKEGNIIRQDAQV